MTTEPDVPAVSPVARGVLFGLLLVAPFWAVVALSALCFML